MKLSHWIMVFADRLDERFCIGLWDRKLVSIITDIKCPICRDRISGRNQDELTETLRAHLAETHQITRISEERKIGPSSSGTSVREGAMLSTRDPSMLTPEESRHRDEITRVNRSQLGSETSGEAMESSRTIQESSQWKYPRMETEEERAVGTWKSENRPGESGQGYQSAERTERGYPSEAMRSEERWREEKGYGGKISSSSSVSHGGGTWHRMMNRGEMTMAMACPLCGNPVYGSDDDDLDDELRFHFKDYHQIRRR